MNGVRNGKIASCSDLFAGIICFTSSVGGVTNSTLGTRKRQFLEIFKFCLPDIWFERGCYFPQVHSVLTSFFVYSIVIFLDTAVYIFLK